MNKKRLNLFLIIGILLVLSFSFVSAGWFSDFFGKITGQATGGYLCSNGQQIGDVNGDGAINSADSSLVLNIASGLVDYPGDICCADFNKDGSIGAADSSFILQIIAGTASSPGTCGEAPVPETTCLPTITSASLPSGIAGTSYSTNLSASGEDYDSYSRYCKPYYWYLSGAILPPGLTLSANGVISGTPTTPGAYTFTIAAADKYIQLTTSKSFNLTITSPSIATCESGYTCLDLSNPKTIVTFDNIVYGVELISSSDTSATIRVANNNLLWVETKEVKEADSKNIAGLDVYVKNADETNLFLSTTLKFSAPISAICLPGYICLSSNNNPETIVNLNNIDYLIELISASYTSATIKITSNDGTSAVKEISEETTKKINGLDVYLRTADETIIGYSAVIKLSTPDQTTYCTDSDNGIFHYVKGTISYNDPITKRYGDDTDQCAIWKDNIGWNDVNKCSNNEEGCRLKEFYCENNIDVMGIYACPYGCIDGACFDAISHYIECPVQQLEIKTCSFSDIDYTIKRTTGCNIKINYNWTWSGGLNELEEEFELPMSSQKTLQNGILIKNPSSCNSNILELIIGSSFDEAETEKATLCENSCSLNGNCYSYNRRTSGKYCGTNNEWISEIANGESCVDDFECISNVCSSGQCIEGSSIQKILSWFRNLFDYTEKEYYSCGDDIINGKEECDDGNTINGDGCNSTCKIEISSKAIEICANKPNMPNPTDLCGNLNQAFICDSFNPLCEGTGNGKTWKCINPDGINCNSATEKATCENANNGYSRLCEWKAQDPETRYLVCSGIKTDWGVSCKANCNELINQCSSQGGNYKILLQNKLYTFNCGSETKGICNWETDESCVNNVIKGCSNKVINITEAGLIDSPSFKYLLTCSNSITGKECNGEWRNGGCLDIYNSCAASGGRIISITELDEEGHQGSTVVSVK